MMMTIRNSSTVLLLVSKLLELYTNSEMLCLGKNTRGENIWKCADKNTKQAHNQFLLKKKRLIINPTIFMLIARIRIVISFF